MKQAMHGKPAGFRARSRAPRKEPLPYLSRRPRLKGRLLRLWAWLAVA